MWNQYGMMGFGPGWSMLPMGLHMVFVLVLITLAVFAIVWLVRSCNGRENAVAILRARYARGEISHDEFVERSKGLKA